MFQNNNVQNVINPFKPSFNINNNTNQNQTNNNFGINQFNYNQFYNNNNEYMKLLEHNNYMNKIVGCFDYKPIALNGSTKIVNYSYIDLKESGKNFISTMTSKIISISEKEEFKNYSLS